MGANSPATQQPPRRLPLCASDPAFSSFPGPAVPVSLACPRPMGEMFVLLSTLLVTFFLFHTGPQEEKLARRHPSLSPVACSAVSVGPQPPRPAASGKCLVLTNSSRCPVVAVALSFSENSFFSLCLLSLEATSVWILNLPTLSLVSQLYMYPERQGLVT